MRLALVFADVGARTTLGIVLLFPGVLMLLRHLLLKRELRVSRESPMSPAELMAAQRLVAEKGNLATGRLGYRIRLQTEPSCGDSLVRLALRLGLALTVAGLVVLLTGL